MISVLVQCFLIFSPTIVSVFYPLQEIAYSIISLLGVDVTRFEEIINNIIENDKIASIISGIILSIFIYIWRIKTNKDKLFNIGNNYDEYPIWVYWIASKILGYGKVSLVRVPIYLQYKLLMKDVFQEIVVDMDVEEKIQSIVVIEENMENISDELNLILIDTYEITKNQIPSNKTSMPTIFIKSGNETDSNRSLNTKFIKEIRRITNKYSSVYKQVNVFSTTNTNHNQLIVCKCFKNGRRTGFKHVIVYQASRSSYMFNRGYKVL